MKPKKAKKSVPVKAASGDSGKPFEAGERKFPPPGLSQSDLLRWFRENK